MEMINPDLPLIDLHRHLESNVRLETILDLSQQHQLPLPAWDVDRLRPYVQVITPLPGVMAFISKFQWMTGVMVDVESCYRIAYENVFDARREGLDYVELRFSPWFMAESHRLNPAGVVESVVAGVKKGQQETGLKVNLIGILSRTYGPEIAWRELEALMTQKDSLIALDLAGDEALFPATLFREHFQRARDAGWQIIAHAGESAGHESIWASLRDLRAVRIGHAVRALDDATLVDYLAEHRIGIETCLTCNVQTRTVLDYFHHPARTFLEHGLLVTLNTDDPGISGITLPYELEVAAPAAGLTPEQIRRAQCNALEVAFLSHDEKQTLLELQKRKPEEESDGRRESKN